MKSTGPILIGMVIGLIAFSMSNNSSAGESDGDPAAAVAGESRNDAGSDGHDSGDFPDTGGATVPKLPSRLGADHVVTLSFDDGPHPTFTPQILDMLADHDATAVFCVVGEKVRQHPELVQRIVADGHVLCNHSYSHDHQLTSRPAATIEKEIDATSDAVSAAVPGVPVSLFRQPGTHVQPAVAAVLEKRGMAVFDWTVDPRDWQRPDASTIVDRVMDQVEPGSVVLLHDGGGERTETVKALATILAMLRSSGYTTVVPTAP
jgi:peptidoglycan-N-acetylglucosamine deacetylase